MEIQEQKQGAVTVVRPRGPLIGDDVEEVQNYLQDAISRSMGRCVIDASGITFADSQGLEALLDVSENLGESGQALKLCGVTETIREVLQLTDLSSHFEHFEDVQTAVRSFL